MKTAAIFMALGSSNRKDDLAKCGVTSPTSPLLEYSIIYFRFRSLKINNS